MTNQIVIYELIEDANGKRGVGDTVTMFKAPDNGPAAKQLFVFLVDNLQPGFFVELRTSNGAAELTRPSGAKISPELYAAIMGG